MKYEDRTKEQLVRELTELSQRVAELETLEVEHKQVGEALRGSRRLSRSVYPEAAGRGDPRRRHRSHALFDRQ